MRFRYNGKKNINYTWRYTRVSIKVLASALVIFLLLFLTGCGSLGQTLFGWIKKQDKASPALEDPPVSESAEIAATPASIAEENNTKADSESDGTAETKEETPGSSGPSQAELAPGNNPGIKDLEKQREYFKKGIEFFEDGNYIIAEYYFNQIKNTYKILGDHILYYYARSLLMQEKYELAEKNYIELKTRFADSVFSEKASLEHADLFFIKQNYSAAEIAYTEFIKTFPKSQLITYSRYQLAVCQQLNDKPLEAFENYKKIWLEYPENEYADEAYAAIKSMEEEGTIDKFVPSNDQIFRRGEIFFDLYRYENALEEFTQILESTKTSPLNDTMHARTLFKTGMCHFNMRDYSTARDYLSSCYSKFPSSSYADESLYFLARVYTNLDQDPAAIEKYEEILTNFPGSNYADDALYRIGRIYLVDDDLANAEKYFQRIVNEYPGGDRVKEIYWILGWIQYRNGNYSNAKETFSGMAAMFGRNQPGEQGLFWKARCSEKMGQTQEAIDSYKQITDYNAFSYYTFAAKTALDRLGQTVQLKAIDTSVYPDNPDIEQLLPDVFRETAGKGSADSSPGNDDTAGESDTAGSSDSVSGSSDTTDPAGTTAPDHDDSNSTDSGNVSGTDGPDTGSGSPAEIEIKFSHIDKAKELLVIELYESAAVEIEAASSEIATNSTGILAISTLYLEAKDYINSQKIISKNLTKLRNNLSGPYEDYLYYLLYPYGYREYVDKYSKVYGVDPLYILALIREESRFQPEVGSYAGAQGLMQIMPKTGRSIAASIGISGYNDEMLHDPEKNIMMGTYYISAQLDNFNGNKYYACGAYNGGPGAMSRWVSKYGSNDIDEFIESISYDETRNYVKKVMCSYFFYQILYGEKDL